MGRDFNYINVYKMQSRMNELGMRQKDLAEKSGVSPMCISNVITDTSSQESTQSFI